MDYRLDADGFGALWDQMASAGLPLPGEAITDTWLDESCEMAESGR